MKFTREHVLTLVVAVLSAAAVGFGAGYGASDYHPGPAGARGLSGASGARGNVGAAGPAGAAGAAASVQQLGVCFSYTTWTSGGSTWINSVDVSSPYKNHDGTVSCPTGTYVPVTPQGP